MIYELNSHVRYSEVDAQCNLTLLALQAYFQDCSVFQSEKLQIGIDYLAEHHIAWVLSSWQICVEEMPKLAEEIKVRTWAYDFKGFYGYRNFDLLNSAGKVAAYANSVWVLVDAETGRPVKIDLAMVEQYGMHPKIQMECAERKILIPEVYEEKSSIRVPKFFIDTNQHMNNEKYVMIAQEFLPGDFHICEIRVEYKKAAVLDDVIHPRVTINDDTVTVVLADDNGKPYSIVKFIGQSPKK